MGEATDANLQVRALEPEQRAERLSSFSSDVCFTVQVHHNHEHNHLGHLEMS